MSAGAAISPIQNPVQNPVQLASDLVGSHWISGGVSSSLLSNLSAGYKFEAASGSRVDVLGVNPLSEVNGPIVNGAGKIGNAALLVAASSQRLNATNSAPAFLVAGLDWTLAFWVNFTATGLAAICGQGGGAFHVFTRTNQLEFRSYDGSIFPNLTKAYVQANNTWYFVVAQFDSATKTKYLNFNNGTPATQVMANQIADTASPFTVGDNIAGFGFLGGLVDELYLWKSATGGGGLLTAAQLTNLYNAGAGATYPFTGIP